MQRSAPGQRDRSGGAKRGAAAGGRQQVEEQPSAAGGAAVQGTADGASDGADGEYAAERSKEAARAESSAVEGQRAGVGGGDALLLGGLVTGAGFASALFAGEGLSSYSFQLPQNLNLEDDPASLLQL